MIPLARAWLASSSTRSARQGIDMVARPSTISPAENPSAAACGTLVAMPKAAARAGVTVQVHCYRIAGPIAYVRGEAWDLDPADPIATVQGAFVHNGAPA